MGIVHLAFGEGCRWRFFLNLWLDLLLEVLGHFLLQRLLVGDGGLLWVLRGLALLRLLSLLDSFHISLLLSHLGLLVVLLPCCFIVGLRSCSTASRRLLLLPNGVPGHTATLSEHVVIGEITVAEAGAGNFARCLASRTRRGLPRVIITLAGILIVIYRLRGPLVLACRSIGLLPITLIIRRLRRLLGLVPQH